MGPLCVPSAREDPECSQRQRLAICGRPRTGLGVLAVKASLLVHFVVPQWHRLPHAPLEVGFQIAVVV